MGREIFDISSKVRPTHTSALSSAVHLIAALIAILPDAIILFRMDIARNLHQVDDNARILISRRERHNRHI